ncbi:MAG: radical SAM protein, partial [Thermodesulfatator sp.]
MEKRPSYLRLLETGELEKRAERARSMLASCTLCPHECKVNRLEGERGFCQTGTRAKVASFGAHFGEEPPITGRAGSGTVFFSGCNVKCVFCQNFEISQGSEGYEVEKEYLAFIFLSLQQGGCHNVNLVTPTHVVPQILDALILAAKEGLKIPIVYNCGGYESLETLGLLESVVDIYMPDMKYSSNELAL